MTPETLMLLVVTAFFLFSLATILKHSLISALGKLLVGTAVLCLVTIEWAESLPIVLCTAMGFLLLTFGLADLIVVKMEASRRDTSEPDVGR